MTKQKNTTKRLKKKKVRRKKVEVRVLVDRARWLLTAVLLLTLISCGGNKDVNAYAEYVKVVANADSTINELSAVSGSQELNGRLNARFQSVSENTALVSKIPEKRLEEKATLLAKCRVQFDNCSYVPEGYSFEIHRNFLNLTYQYNAFQSYDVYFKHAVIDLATGRRMLYLNMFEDPNLVLEQYTARYREQYELYLAEFSGEYLSEDEQDEYDIIKNHLDTKEPFQLHELNNCELVFDGEKNCFTEIRFHYNGSGGVYKTILTAGYVSIPLKEISSLLTEEFQGQLGKIR